LEGLAIEDVSIYYGYLVYFTAIFYIFCGNFVSFYPFWYIVPRKIWQPFTLIVTYNCSEEEEDPEVCGEGSGEGGEAPHAQPDAEDHFAVVAVAEVAEHGGEHHVENDEHRLQIFGTNFFSWKSQRQLFFKVAIKKMGSLPSPGSIL
jgi:hypothetical protein